MNVDASSSNGKKKESKSKESIVKKSDEGSIDNKEKSTKPVKDDRDNNDSKTQPLNFY